MDKRLVGRLPDLEKLSQGLEEEMRKAEEGVKEEAHRDEDDPYLEPPVVEPWLPPSMHRPMEPVEKLFLKQYWKKMQAHEEETVDPLLHPDFFAWHDAQWALRMEIGRWVDEQKKWLPHGVDMALRYQMAWGDI